MERLGSISTLVCAGILCCGLLSSAVHAGDGDANDKLTALGFKYAPASCENWFTEDRKASCVDFADAMPEEVRIVAQPVHGRHRIWYDGIVKKGKEFTVDALNGEKITFTGASILFDIFDLEGALLQQIEIGINGKDDALVKDDVYASLTLKKIVYKFKIPKDQEVFVQYIVNFDDMVSWEAIEAYFEYWEYYGVEMAMALPLLNALVLKVPDYITPEELADDPLVTGIEYDQELGVKELLDGQGRSFIRPMLRELEKIDKEKLVEYPWSVLKLYEQPYGEYSTDEPVDWMNEEGLPEVIEFALKQFGKNKIRVAFFDTGISKEHKRVGVKLKGGLDVVNGRNNNGKFKSGKPIDDNGHGTHVAGTLSTLLDKDHKWGGGAKVELYAVKILDRYALGKLSNILMGLQWAIDNDIDIINMSIGYRNSSPAIERAIRDSAKAGLIMVASVGNHSNYDDGAVLHGSAEGGSAEGGSAEGGSAEGGSAEGGSAEGGSAEGGSAEGGSAEGGSAEGGSAEGGSAGSSFGEVCSGVSGSAEGGSAEGGSAEGGSAEGGSAEGGSAEGGSAEGGSAEGGSAEGGSAEGGSAEGGSAEGGSAEGGSAEGGSAEGGSAEGGSAEGGSATGCDTNTLTTSSIPLYSVMYPARYPEVIAVGASDLWGELTAFSNDGVETDILAPGVDILSWDITNDDVKEGFGSTSGTSMATPYVTAAAALMLSLDPTLSLEEIRDILKRTAHYNHGAAFAGDLNLAGALNEVMVGVLGQDPADLERKELEKQYKEMLKAKIRGIGDKLWD